MKTRDERLLRVARGVVTTALNAVVLLSILRGLRSRRRGLLPLAAAYVAQRMRRRRR